jgi:hypothetical protein
MSPFRQAVANVREGFLLTAPRSLHWTTDGWYYVDDVAVSQRVYDLAEAEDLAAARTAWLDEWDAAHGKTA